MKIILVNDYGVRRGGAEEYVIALSQLLKARGHQVLIVSSDIMSNNLFSDKQIKSSGHIYNLDSFFNPVIYYQFKKILAEFKPDLVHYHNIFYHLSSSVFYAAKSYPRICTVHDYYSICYQDKYLNEKICNRKFANCVCHKHTKLDYLRKKIARRCLQNMDLLIAPSEYLKQTYLNESKTNFETLYPVSLSEKFNSDIQKQDFVYCGRLEAQKGIQDLIKIFIGKNLNSKLHIIGSGKLENELKKMVSNLNADNQVVFHGHLVGQAKNDLIKSAIAHILPSRWPEVFGLTVVEAAKLSTVSIVADVGGLSELSDSLSGYKFSNLTQLGDLLEEADKNPQKFIESGKIAYINSEKYNQDNHISDLEQKYKKIILSFGSEL